MEEMLRPFQIKIEVHQGLLPTFFNCVIEKVIDEWRKRLPNNGIRLGRCSKAMEIDCLVFPDDFILIEAAEATCL